MTDRAPDTVVFLGPSLARDAAAAILDATYVPPAQFGDVYRWIGSSVRAFVVIDGVFHGRAPVWQRELLAALHAGIRVYGAASMGALRAVELRPYGMIGLGTVYEWYIAGEIDGDDEVAMLHASAEQHYRALSVPLVNLRASLRAAVAHGVVDEAYAADITAHVKRLPFWLRNLNAVGSAPAVVARAPQLRAWLAEHAIDVKRRDAELALAEVARGEVARGEVHALPAGASPYDRFRLLKRGFAQVAGDPALDGAALVARLLADPAQHKLLRWSLSARFFVVQWAADAQVVAPDVADRPPPPPEWLRANALSAVEHAALVARQALPGWLIAQPPEAFGLGTMLENEALLPELPVADLKALRPVCSRQALARMLPWVAAWCERAGAAPADGARFHAAMWAIDRGPEYFGFATWSFAAELLSLVQWIGAVAARKVG